MLKRKPAVAGTFYPASSDALKKQLEELFLQKAGALPQVNNRPTGKIKALICPHAGYIYSGAIASCSFSALAKDHSPKRVLLIGPNHTGYGTKASLFPEGEWETPLGILKVDNSWVTGKASEIIIEDETAHIHEHSLEVQLPFLQYLYADSFTISLLTLGDQTANFITALTEGLAQTELPLIIASSDLCHYETASSAKYKDNFLIEAFKRRDVEDLFKEVEEKNITACGYGPIAIVAGLAKKNNWLTEVLCYGTSGDITGDKSSVVSYMAAIATEE